MTEFNLSEKISIKLSRSPDYEGILFVKDVKEFIRRLKEAYLSYNLQKNLDYYNIISEIDKLAGEELI